MQNILVWARYGTWNELEYFNFKIITCNYFQYLSFNKYQCLNKVLPEFHYFQDILLVVYTKTFIFDTI